MSCSCIDTCTCQNCLPSSNLVIPCFSTTTTSTSFTTTTTTTTQIISYCYTVKSSGQSGYCIISWTDHDGVFQNARIDTNTPNISFCAKEYSIQKTCFVGRTCIVYKSSSLCISDNDC